MNSDHQGKTEKRKIQIENNWLRTHIPNTALGQIQMKISKRTIFNTVLPNEEGNYAP